MKAIEIVYRYDASGKAARPRPANADAARHRLEEGSRKILALLDSLSDGTGTARHVITPDPRDLGLTSDENGTPMQRPYAAVLGCSDARVPIELIFNEGPNDLFVVRVAGNGLGSEVLGSLKYASEHLGESLKLVVVLGHSSCGAVSAAVDVFQNPKTYLSLASDHELRSILDRLLIMVHASAARMQSMFGPEVIGQQGYREALIETAIVLNAAFAARTAQMELGSTDPNGLRAVYGVYMLAGRQLWAPRSGSAECAGLAYPPADSQKLGDFLDRVVQSERIASLLKAMPMTSSADRDPA
jgi:carbonic anhydrase